jgi:hypothetical protein
MRRIGIIVGHTRQAPGAINFKGEHEYFFNDRIASKIQATVETLDVFKEVDLHIFHRDFGGIAGIAKQITGIGRFDLTLELHFNANGGKPAHGCEVLIYDKDPFFKETSIIADVLTNDLAKEFGLVQRGSIKISGDLEDGIKVIDSDDRGYLNLKMMSDAGVLHPILIEPCFGDSDTPESHAIFDNEDKYATFLARKLLDYTNKSHVIFQLPEVR